MSRTGFNHAVVCLIALSVLFLYSIFLYGIGIDASGTCGLKCAFLEFHSCMFLAC